MSRIIYNKLLTIRLTHEYYADTNCKDFIIQPTTSTQKLLRNYGILLKNLPNGAILLYEASDDSGTSKFPIDKDLKLSFKFFLQNTLFPNFTDVVFSPESSSIYYFNNLSPSVVGLEHTILDSSVDAPLPLKTKILSINKEGPTASYVILTDIENKRTKTKFNVKLNELKIDLSTYNDGKYVVQQFDNSNTPLGTSFTFYYNKDISGEMPYGVFEVFLDDTYDQANPITYLFNFKSRETYWRFNILKNEANPPIALDDINASTITVQHEPDNPADKIDFDIATGTDPILIPSADVVKLSETGYDKIRLYKNSSILLSNLPNASAEKIDLSGDDWVSDIYVYVYV